MTELPSKFGEFLVNIRPTDRQVSDYIDGHEQLRERLQGDEDLSKIHVGDFLQGSYARRTAVKPIGDEKSDVDVVFVTNLPKSEYDASEAMKLCEPFLKQYYPGQWERNQRSYKIELNRVEMDLVLTAAPSEAVMAELSADDSIGQANIEDVANQEDMRVIANAVDATFKGAEKNWQDEPLDIPDRKFDTWDKTHPLATLDWTIDKNDRTNKHYVNVVKTIKWWRRTQVSEPERPKGYPLEHIVGWCCPDGIESVAEGVTLTFEDIAQRYATHAQNAETPFLGARGLPDNNVLARIDGEDFAAFHENVVEAADLARQALNEQDPSTSRDLWYSLLGDEFPQYGNEDDDNEGERQSAQFRSSSGSTSVSDQRFA